MYSNGDKSPKHLQNPMENPCSEKLCRNYMKIIKHNVKKPSRIVPKSKNGVQGDPVRRKSEPKGVQEASNRRPGGVQEASKATPIDLETSKKRPRGAKLDLLVFYRLSRRPQSTGRMRSNALITYRLGRLT